tara:strand:- start:2996 stop:3151 length:156 start_codon:yes stop_codon:yes gene_type:complete
MGCSSCGRNKFNSGGSGRSTTRKSSTGKTFRTIDNKKSRTARLKRPTRKIR